MTGTGNERAEDEVVTRDSPEGAARRLEPRVAAECRVRYESLDRLVEAYTEDISRGGLYVRTTKFLPIGAVVRLQLTMPGGTDEVSVLARVAFVLDEKTATEHHRQPGMGMGFLDVGDTPLADTIAKYLAKTAPKAEVPASPAGHSSRVLIVDDDAGYRSRAAEIIGQRGHKVVVAENGIDALRIAMQGPPDLILTDVQMPVLDGWQLVRMLRARPSLAHIPVIFVTSLSSDEERLQGYRLGVDDYISKPYNEDELGLRTQRVLERARAFPESTVTQKALRGDLSHVSLPSLLMFLEMERRSGVLLVVQKNEYATIHLRDGNVVRVDLPEELDYLDGSERLLELLDWTEGRFELADAEVRFDDNIGLSISHAVLEHARRTDEFSGSDTEEH